MTIREVRVRYTGPTGAAGESVAHYSEAYALSTLRTDLRNAYLAWASVCSDQWSFALASEVRLIDEATGEMTGVDNFSSPWTVPGADAEEPVPTATAMYVRARTGGFRAGRRVAGGTYLPGATISQLNDGEWATSAVDAANSWAAVALATRVIWSRPSPGGGSGAAYGVTGMTPWSECSSQRRRR